MSGPVAGGALSMCLKEAVYKIPVYIARVAIDYPASGQDKWVVKSHCCH